MDQATREIIGYSILAAILIAPAIWLFFSLRHRRREEARRFAARRHDD